MDRTSQRRFIAGATCPRCGEVDKVFTQIRISTTSGLQEGSELRERGCVACDFLETVSEIESTVDRGDTAGSVPAEEWSPVKLPE